MSGETIVTIVGNLVSDPELRFTPSGAAVANFTVASTPRKFDKQNNEWKDGETLFMRCSIWRDAAENVTESCHRGDRVIVTGNLTSRSYETREGEKRTVVELDVTEIGASLKNATAAIKKAARSGVDPHRQTPWGQATPTADDPWATPKDPGQSGWGGENSGQPIRGTVHTPPSGGWDEPPF